MEVHEVINYDRIETLFKRKRVCAYARVSTIKDVAIESFDTQVRTYSNMIINNTEWDFAGVYADEGKSGTNTKYRDDFNKMVEVAKAGHIDMIITKSISRFARNTIDSIDILRKLKSYGTEVFFENENISSMDPKIEFVISVLSGIAQEEAKNVSENVKWSIKNRFKNGNVKLIGSKVYGYSSDNEGNFIIDEQQAIGIKKIFEMYTQGFTSKDIIKWLESNNMKTNTGKTIWQKSTINYILKNDIYTGTLTMQKTYRPSYKSKNKVRNDGELPKYIVEDNHDSIITKEQFLLAQEIRINRIMKYHNSSGEIDKIKYTSTTFYSGMFHCPECNKNFRYKGNSTKPTNVSKLICSSNISTKTCQSDAVQTVEIDRAIKNQLKTIIENEELFFIALKDAFYKRKQYKLDLNELSETEGKLTAYKGKLTMLDLRDGSLYRLELLENIKVQIESLEQVKARLNNKFVTDYDYEKYKNKFVKVFKIIKHSEDMIDDFNFRSLFSKVIIHNREQLTFVIGEHSGFTNKELKKTKIYFETEHEYLIRKTRFIMKYGIKYI